MARIVAVSPSNLRIDHCDGTPETTYQIAPTVQVTLNGHRGTLADLQRGDEVRIGGEPADHIEAIRPNFPQATHEDIVPEVPPPEARPDERGDPSKRADADPHHEGKADTTKSEHFGDQDRGPKKSDAKKATQTSKTPRSGHASGQHRGHGKGKK